MAAEVAKMERERELAREAAGAQNEFMPPGERNLLGRVQDRAGDEAYRLWMQDDDITQKQLALAAADVVTAGGATAVVKALASKSGLGITFLREGADLLVNKGADMAEASGNKWGAEAADTGRDIYNFALNPIAWPLLGPYSAYRGAKGLFNVLTGNKETVFKPGDFRLTLGNMTNLAPNAVIQAKKLQDYALTGEAERDGGLRKRPAAAMSAPQAKQPGQPPMKKITK